MLQNMGILTPTTLFHSQMLYQQQSADNAGRISAATRTCAYVKKTGGDLRRRGKARAKGPKNTSAKTKISKEQQRVRRPRFLYGKSLALQEGRQPPNTPRLHGFFCVGVFLIVVEQQHRLKLVSPLDKYWFDQNSEHNTTCWVSIALTRALARCAVMKCVGIALNRREWRWLQNASRPPRARACFKCACIPARDDNSRGAYLTCAMANASTTTALSPPPLLLPQLRAPSLALRQPRTKCACGRPSASNGRGPAVGALRVLATATAARGPAVEHAQRGPGNLRRLAGVKSTGSRTVAATLAAPLSKARGPATRPDVDDTPPAVVLRLPFPRRGRHRRRDGGGSPGLHGLSAGDAAPRPALPPSSSSAGGGDNASPVGRDHHAAPAAARRLGGHLPRPGARAYRLDRVLAVLAPALVRARDAAVEALAVPLQAGRLAAPAPRVVDQRARSCSAPVCR